MRLEAAIRGDLKKIMKEETAAAEKAVTLGVVAASNGLKAELRTQVTRAGLGEKMARTWKLLDADAEKILDMNALGEVAGGGLPRVERPLIIEGVLYDPDKAIGGREGKSGA